MKMVSDLENIVASDFWKKYLDANDLQREEMLKNSVVDSMMELEASEIKEEKRRELLTMYLQVFIADLILTMEYENTESI